MKMKVKMDINELCERIMQALNSSKSSYVKEYGFSIEIGLNIFLSYLKEITERALKIDDAVIMSALLNIGAIIPDSAEEEKQIHERAKNERQSTQGKEEI